MTTPRPRLAGALVAAAGAGGLGAFVHRRRARSTPPPPPPVSTQSSPGQIADLQQAYGAEMQAAAPRLAPQPAADA